jgi:hypothetical protein
MTAPITTLRAKLQPSEPHRYLADDFAEWAMSKQGREDIALFLLAAGCIGLIIALGKA